jgi:OPA family glycerol-3-phosphate transporter-like MFS transporter
MPIEQISPHLQRAVLAGEDSHFFQHDGFDWDAIEKAWEEAQREGEKEAKAEGDFDPNDWIPPMPSFKRGASTVTQQLAKNLYLSEERSFFRKGREALITYFLVRDTPQSQGLPPIERYSETHAPDYSESHEKELSTKQILLDYVLVNKMIWFIAGANVFIYLVRYGVLDWAPTYLKEAKGFTMNQTGWAYFLYEWAGIPGTLICGWLSDKIFKGRRAPATIIYMVLVTIAVFIYWKNPPGNPLVDNVALIAIGFLIYGPVMLIGVHALDLVPKKAAGTAAGLTGFFGYLGGAVFANAAMGFVVDKWGWDGGFIVLIAACILAIGFTALTWKKERVSLHS